MVPKPPYLSVYICSHMFCSSAKPSTWNFDGVPATFWVL